MSLNGLDTDAVVQAHQNAVTEAGGWFLLKYASRDTVELLANGVGGVNEARSAIEKYEEKSPLYGLVHYRRKKFILKYVPDGTSRLLQVRLAVQFQSILDAFSSHDTVFAFSNAEELSESALGLNTILKSGSKTSSTSSLRQQRLKEIVEDNEETSNAESISKLREGSSEVPETPIQPQENSNLPASAARAKAMLAQRRSESMQSSAPVLPSEQEKDITPVVEQQHHEALVSEPEDIVSPSQFPPRTSSFSTDKVLPVPPEESGSPVSLSRIVSAYQRPSLDFSIPPIESDSDDDFRRPMPKEYHRVPLSNHLTATESSNISRWTDEVVASTRSKSKRAPKPHSDNQPRPKTSGASEDTLASRRVANLPSSVRVANRAPSQQSSRPGSQQSARSMPGRFVPSPNLPPPLPSPTMPESPEQRVHRKPGSQASASFEAQSIAPEKLRLMKALQMRKRNQLLAQRSTSAGSATIATLNSIDSSSSRSSISMAPQNSAQKQTEPLAIDNLEVSITTSPISLVTASDTQSTKPSSISEQSPANHSSTSLSSDTNSSTTPKADDEEIPTKIVSPPARSGLDQHANNAQPTAEPLRVNTDKPLPQPVPEIAREEDLVDPTDSTSLRGTKKRYQFEGRINIPPSTADPSDVSDDESFMEELQNATVQEAKPMSVNRTPMTPVLAKVPTRDGRDWTPVSPSELKSRTASHGSQASTPDRRPVPSRAGSTRSLSTALPQWPPVPTEPVPALPKQRPQISAGIVTRVKTFESLGLKEAGSLPPPTPREPSSRMSSFSNMLKRASVISHIHHSDKSEKAASISPPSPPALEPESEDDSEILNSRPIVQRPGNGAEVYTPVHKGESVSITARIVRDTDAPHTSHGSGDTREMHWSPLIVEHQKSGDLTRPPLPRDLSTQSADSLPTSLQERRRFSFSSHKTATKPLSPTETKSHRLSSAGSHKRPSRAASESSSITDEKKGSRASRMLKRLSAISMSRSKNKESPVTSPTYEIPHPETINEQSEILDPQAMRTVVDIGEVNVQFPETLLWKRRFLRVDDQGFLIFAAPVNDSRTTHGKSRKIHLDELLRPALPDREREQMAWSIVLDLKTGGTVQCACESGSAQRSFLKMLVDAHSAYNQLYTS